MAYSLDTKSSSEATGGAYGGVVWNQGDQVVSYASDARSGDRTAPVAGSLAGALGGSLMGPALIASAVVLAALLWKRLR